jgi:nucleoside transporter
VLHRVQTVVHRAGAVKLSALLFLHAMALGMWFVPLGTVLHAHGYGDIRPYAFASSSLAAFISPLVFGALADRHIAPTLVLRGLSFAAAATMALAAWGIQQRFSPVAVLALIQLHSLFSVPAWSISSTVVFSQLDDSQRQYGPLRAMATLGWMVGCWVVSLMRADTSVLAAYSGAATWLGLGLFTLSFPSVSPPESKTRPTLVQRLGLDALSLLRNHDHRVVFITAALFSIPIAAFYPFTPVHLRDLGFERTSAWMTIGQITEVVTLIVLARVLTRWRLKWVFAGGLAFGVLRYALCALDGKLWILLGISLHGFAFTLFFITAQLYVNDRMDPAWRARAQALLSLVTGGIGNLLGYLGTGWWHSTATRDAVTHWPLFWMGISGGVCAVMVYFLIAYHGRDGCEKTAGQR